MTTKRRAITLSVRVDREAAPEEIAAYIFDALESWGRSFAPDVVMFDCMCVDRVKVSGKLFDFTPEDDDE